MNWNGGVNVKSYRTIYNPGSTIIFTKRLNYKSEKEKINICILNKAVTVFIVTAFYSSYTMCHQLNK